MTKSGRRLSAEQAHVLQRAKGIGPKAAKQIILDLKDKLSKEAPDGPVLFTTLGADTAMRDEALSALVSLGFGRIPVQKALNQIVKDNPGLTKVEDLIKMALKTLA